MRWGKGLLGGLLFVFACVAWALTPEQALRIASGDNDARIAALNEVAASGDAALVPFVQAMLADEVKADGQFNVVWKTPGPVQADPWSDYIPENKGKKNEPALMAKK